MRKLLILSLPLCLLMIPGRVVAAEPIPSSEKQEVGEDGAEEVNSQKGEKRAQAPLSGWNNGVFYLRDKNDNFQLFPGGRVNIDFNNYFGQGLSDTLLKSTFSIRRMRAEFSGNLGTRFSFGFSADFAPTGVTNRASPGKNPSVGAAETASSVALPVDAFVTFRALAPDAYSSLNLQAGQFDGPFMMENRSSDKYLPFLERSLAVRAVGEPNNKELGAMVWGEFKNKIFGYQIGLFNAPGPNRVDTDGQFDVMGRLYLRPFATQKDWGPLALTQVGASAKYGRRDAKFDYYDYPAMTTQGGFAFWSPTYTGANGQVVRVLPSDTQSAVAGEFRIPLPKDIELRGELVYIKNSTRESYDGTQVTSTERLGTMSGHAYYVLASFFPIGNADSFGLPGFVDTPKLDFSKPAPRVIKPALQLLAKWEQVSLKYESNSRGGTSDPKGLDGSIKLNAISLGANLWYSRNVRFGVNYIYNMTPDSGVYDSATKTFPSNRAVAPGNTLPSGMNDTARREAHGFHELLFRLAFQL